MEKVEKSEKKCPSCGGILKFSPKDANLKCQQCQNVYKIEKTQNKVIHKLDEIIDGDFSQNNFVFNCENCGSKIVLNNLEITKKCPYCGSFHIVKTRLNPGIKPDYIIPFRFDKLEASTFFKNAMAKKFFAPNEFKKKPPLDKIYGIFVPTFSYDAHSESVYRGEIAEHFTNDMSVTSRRPVHGRISLEHENVMVESSSKMNQVEFDSILPFDYKNFYNYNDDFLLGYYLEYHETPVKSCNQVAHTKMTNEIKHQIRKKYFDEVSNLTVNSTFSEEKFSYYLLPTYLCEYNYKDKVYHSFVNGQTGKVGGKTPKSKVKITFFVLALLLLGVGFVALMAFLI